jgi:hypothetical protein
MEINRDLIRWLLLIALMPIGWPFLKALWQDFNGALREEGGLFGAPPSAREIEQIREEKKREPDTLVSEPWVRPGQVRKPRLRGRTDGGDAGPRAPRANAPRRGPPRFR